MKNLIEGACLEEAKKKSFLMNTRIHIVIPSVLARGEYFTARVSAVNSDGVPVADFKGRLFFEDSPGIHGLPGVLEFPSGIASLSLSGLEAGNHEAAFIRGGVELPGGERYPVFSNPCWIYKDPPFRVYWGDLHFHTTFSECGPWRSMHPEWGYAYARDISFLDFASACDHLRGLNSEKGRWDRLKTIAEEFNQPGLFSAFLSFESSHATGFGGDNNVYFRDVDGDLFWPERKDMKGSSPEIHLRELWARMDDSGADYFTVPHHTGRFGKFRSWDDPCYQPEKEPLFEIYSSWGSSETRCSRYPLSGGNNDATSYFTDALGAGARFGVIASSDDHATMPGSMHHFRSRPLTAPANGGYAHMGLAAIRSSKLERSSLFDSMRVRKTYASTEERALLDFKVNDASLGEEFTACGLTKRKRELNVKYNSSSAAPVSITIMRNGEPLNSKVIPGRMPDSSVGFASFEDTENMEKICIENSLYSPAPFIFYYARIEDASGNCQWSSPVWINMKE